MIDIFGSFYFNAGTLITDALYRAYRETQEKNANLTPEDNAHKEAMHALQVAKEVCERVPLETLSREIDRALKSYKDGAITDRLQTELERLGSQFHDELNSRYFLPLSRFAENYYGQKTAFGEAVAEKFPEASEDIENAGNCLAVGQNAACVFHLMRAMEVVVQKYARRFGLRADLNVTWVVLASNMATKVNSWPKKGAKTSAERRSGPMPFRCYGTLKSHGDPTMHPKKTYTSSQALQAYNAVRTSWFTWLKRFKAALCDSLERRIKILRRFTRLDLTRHLYKSLVPFGVGQLGFGGGLRWHVTYLSTTSYFSGQSQERIVMTVLIIATTAAMIAAIAAIQAARWALKAVRICEAWEASLRSRDS